MTPANAYERVVVDYVRRYPDVADVAVVGGAKHRALRFTHEGKRFQMTLNSNNGAADAALKLQDVRRLLGGPPPDEPERERRTLEEMTQLPTEGWKPAWEGTVALRTSGSPMIVFRAPPIAGTASLTYRAKMIEPRLWEVIKDLNARGKFYLPKKSKTAQLDLGGKPFLTALGNRGFAATPARVTLTPEGALRFELTEAPRWIQAKAPAQSEASVEAVIPQPQPETEVMPAAAIAQRIATTPPVASEPPGAAPTKAEAQPTSLLETDIRSALDALRRVEAETPYRLKRVRGADGEERWAFVAPRIE